MRQLYPSIFGVILLSGYAASQTLSCAPGTDCCDRHQFCKFWAMKGECSVNPSWMTVHCQLSCQSCVVQPQPVATTASPIPAATETVPGAPSGCRAVFTTEVLTRPIQSAVQVRQRMQQTGCAAMQVANDCQRNLCFHRKYRSFDGSCNNLQHPALGAAFTPYERLAKADYDDNLGALTSSLRRNRPNPREITVFLLSSRRNIKGPMNGMVMQFGQFLSHDITRNAVTNLCTGCNTRSTDCFAMRAPPGDDKPHKCTDFTRSRPVCGTGQNGVTREQFNENTAFIDASQIYSSDQISQQALRTGMMMAVQMSRGGAFPPNRPGPNADDMTAGDNRANLFIGLAAQHTTWVRLHNNIASSFSNMNPRWNGERVYQETRKVVGAMMQVVTYKEFLPALIGPFNDRLMTPYKRYQPNVNPGILNEFAAAAYRLHGMIHPKYSIRDRNYNPLLTLDFVDGINKFSMLLSSGLDGLYRDLIATPARAPQRISTPVTEDIFGGSSDMASINVQRGRDHGLRSYNEYRTMCNLNKLKDFNQWPEVTEKAVRQRIAQLYNTPDDIDLYVGGIVEEPIEGSFVGPTFACIIAEQFTRLRDADRFYYENPEVFTAAQKAELDRVTLSWIICSTEERMDKIVPNAFEIDERGAKAVPCHTLKSPNLAAWRE